MAHFAELDENNIVIRVVVVPDEQENRGQEYLADDLQLGGIWMQTSFTSYGGKKVNPDTREIISDNHFRYNFASPGFLFDKSIGQDGAFIPVKIFDSWKLNTSTCLWEAPIPKPGGNDWEWNEKELKWESV